MGKTGKTATSIKVIELTSFDTNSSVEVWRQR
jgi:hypothetical protein